MPLTEKSVGAVTCEIEAAQILEAPRVWRRTANLSSSKRQGFSEKNGFVNG